MEILEELQSEQLCEEFPSCTPMSFAPITHLDFKPPFIFYLTHAKGSFKDAFYHVTFADLRQLCASAQSNPHKHQNLTKKEKQALDLLGQNDNLIIKRAD